MQNENTGLFVKKSGSADFPGGLMVKTHGFHCRGLGSIPGQGTKILHMTWHKQNKQNQEVQGSDNQALNRQKDPSQRGCLGPATRRATLLPLHVCAFCELSVLLEMAFLMLPTW